MQAPEEEEEEENDFDNFAEAPIGENNLDAN